MQFATILVAVDVHDAENGRAAVARAAAISGGQGRLRLLYVRYFLPTRYSDLLADDFDFREEQEALETMRAWATEAGAANGSFDLVTRRGRVRDEVIADAERAKADLIVIGSHQPSISSRLLGSNASAIVHGSPVSVLVVRG